MRDESFFKRKGFETRERQNNPKGRVEIHIWNSPIRIRINAKVIE